MKSIDSFMFRGETVSESTVFSLVQLCRFCHINSRHVTRLIEHGAIEPLSDYADGRHFSGYAAIRALRATRLQRDLGVNAAGATLALELLDQIEALKTSLSK